MSDLGRAYITINEQNAQLAELREQLAAVKSQLAVANDPTSVGGTAWLAEQYKQRAEKAEAERDDARRYLSKLRDAPVEAARLRDAIARSGFSVMQTSGDWSLHCTTEEAKKAEQVEGELIAENIRLERELAAERAKREAAESERNQLRKRIDATWGELQSWED